MDKQQQSRKFLPQWSFKSRDGRVLELAEFLPTVDGCFINPTKHMRTAIAEHYPEYLDEFDEMIATLFRAKYRVLVRLILTTLMLEVWVAQRRRTLLKT